MNDTKLRIQTTEAQPLEIELDYAYQAESRIREVAFVNKVTAPELCAAFNTAYARLAQSFGLLMYKVGQAEIAVKRRKAVVTLDVIPEQLVERKLGKGNDDIREAFYYTDEEYLKAKDSLASLEAAKELLYIKMNALRMAFEATKSVLKGDGFIGERKGGVSDLPDEIGIGTGPQEVEVGPYVPVQPTTTGKVYSGGWTKPKL